MLSLQQMEQELLQGRYAEGRRRKDTARRKKQRNNPKGKAVFPLKGVIS